MSKKTVAFKAIVPVESRTQSSETTESSVHEIHVPKTDLPYREEFEWMCAFYKVYPEYCEGDDLGTTLGKTGVVLMASTLTTLRQPGTVSEITGLPFQFVAAVLKSMNVHDLWNSSWVEDFGKALLNRTDFANINSSLNSMTEGFWEAFYSFQGAEALMTLRERRLFGGVLQCWTDRNAMGFFDL
jgi:hypothetical protein